MNSGPCNFGLTIDHVRDEYGREDAMNDATTDDSCPMTFRPLSDLAKDHGGQIEGTNTVCGCNQVVHTRPVHRA